MTVEEIVQQSGLDSDFVNAALRALDTEHPPFVTPTRKLASGDAALIGPPTGHARRAVGAWPTPESIASQLVDALEQAAEREPDEERRGFLGKAAAYLGNTGRDLAVEIGAAAISRQMGI